jgi:hypothetical protein
MMHVDLGSAAVTIWQPTVHLLSVHPAWICNAVSDTLVTLVNDPGGRTTSECQQDMIHKLDALRTAYIQNKEEEKAVRRVYFCRYHLPSTKPVLGVHE